ncbi:MAG: hypothetical protein NC218_02445 [Acetobacter sp.]|nr:hypothetical protein [Acetobacter sp.]
MATSKEYSFPEFKTWFCDRFNSKNIDGVTSFARLTCPCGGELASDMFQGYSGSLSLGVDTVCWTNGDNKLWLANSSFSISTSVQFDLSVTSYSNGIMKDKVFQEF